MMVSRKTRVGKRLESCGAGDARAVAEVLLPVLAAATVGCGEQQRRADHAGGPLVDTVDSVIIHETEQAYVGQAAFLFLDDDHFYVSDRLSGGVLIISPRGEIVKVLGRPGSGPGEFTAVGLALPLGKNAVGVVEQRRGILQVFDRKGGSLTFSRRIPGIWRSFAVTGDSIWVGALDPDRRTGLLLWDRRNDTLTQLLRWPDEYERSSPLAGIFTGVHVVAWADSLIVGFGGMSYVLVIAGGEVIDTLRIPFRRRVGVPDDVVEKMHAAGVTGNMDQLVSMVSSLMAAHRFPDGSLGLVYYDHHRDGAALVADGYLTIVDPDRSHACVDARLFSARSPPPRTAFRADTLYVLDQDVRADGEVVSVIRKQVVDAASCRWIPM